MPSISNLPKWAQSLIEDLEKQIVELEDAVAAAEYNENAGWTSAIQHHVAEISSMEKMYKKALDKAGRTVVNIAYGHGSDFNPKTKDGKEYLIKVNAYINRWIREAELELEEEAEEE